LVRIFFVYPFNANISNVAAAAVITARLIRFVTIMLYQMVLDLDFGPKVGWLNEAKLLVN